MVHVYSTRGHVYVLIQVVFEIMYHCVCHTMCCGAERRLGGLVPATMRAEAVAVEVSSLAGGALNSKCSTNTHHNSSYTLSALHLQFKVLAS